MNKRRKERGFIPSRRRGYQVLLRSVSLLATRERPGPHARSITVVVHDDHDASAPSLTSADVTHTCAQGMMASGAWTAGPIMHHLYLDRASRARLRSTAVGGTPSAFAA